jgi:NADPH:quinone reductase-like Zn-dependent oxidoreductase
VSTAATPTPIATMRAVTQDRYGDSSVLRLSNEPIPTPGRGEVVVRVDAAGVDRGTWHLLVGQPLLVRILGFGFRRPKRRIPGLDVAGTITAVGAEVGDLSVGDEVFGISNGSYAEYAVAPASKLARRPESLDPLPAAGMPVSGITALQALRDSARLAAGQRVLILGASGGVGSFAVQLAVAMGAEVTGVCSTSKIDLVRDLGAHHVIDYTVDDPTDGRMTYDAVLEIGGLRSIRTLRRALTERGTLVIVGGENGGRWTGGFGRPIRAVALSPFVRQRLTMVASKERGTDVAALAAYAETGQLRTAVEHVFPLDQVGAAIDHVGEGKARGKVVIAISGQAPTGATS